METYRVNICTTNNSDNYAFSQKVYCYHVDYLTIGYVLNVLWFPYINDLIPLDLLFKYESNTNMEVILMEFL